MSTINNRPAPVLFVPHGGGPLPLLGDASHRPLVDFLKRIPGDIVAPRAILVISAHWEADRPTLLGSPEPELYYDYHGFAPESYQLDFPAENPKPLQDEVLAALSNAGVEAETDDRRGYDHGVFVPLLLMYPKAQIPVMQLSLVSGLDPKFHLELGAALAPLRDAGIMILGSGLSFHNMQFISRGQSDDGANSHAFHDWLVHTLSDAEITEPTRYDRMSAWAQAPHARFCHPREEHLLPLHVCLGAAMGAPAKIVFDEPLFGQRTVGALWE